MILILLALACAIDDESEPRAVVLDWYTVEVPCEGGSAVWTPPDATPLVVSVLNEDAGGTWYAGTASSAAMYGIDADASALVILCAEDVTLTYAVARDE